MKWFLGFVLVLQCAAMSENERIEQYHKRGYTWPPEPHMFKPNTKGWRELSSRRFDQASYVQDSTQKYDLWMQSVSSAFVQPNFTETGWGLTRAPQELVDTLREAIHSAYDAGKYRDEVVDVIDGPHPVFINRPDLTRRVLNELHPMHEAWAGIPLKPYQAYGFRLYRNDSSLFMHVDKSDSHIISSILHIDSSDDAEPWPIIIEDYTGKTNEVILTPGDMLFYESSKCFHGRPTKFIGSWYTSVFVHYHPSDPEWISTRHRDEAHYAVPLHWRKTSGDKPELPEVEVRGTSLREPGCPRNWCNLQDAVHWHGPAEFDYVITAGPTRYPLWGETDEL